MDWWPTLVGASGPVRIALSWAIPRLQARRSIVVKVFGAAFVEAAERGHRPVTEAHFALALIAAPDVARELERRGVSSKDLYLDIEGLLPPRGESSLPLLPSDVGSGGRAVRWLRSRSRLAEWQRTHAGRPLE